MTTEKKIELRSKVGQMKPVELLDYYKSQIARLDRALGDEILEAAYSLAITEGEILRRMT